jgi:hypothetical protein
MKTVVRTRSAQLPHMQRSRQLEYLMEAHNGLSALRCVAGRGLFELRGLGEVIKDALPHLHDG